MVEDNGFTEIEENTESMLPAISNSSLIDLGSEAEQRLDALVKIKRVALKATNPNDWVDQSGKPYLQASGSEKVGRIFGVSWRISEPILEQLEGGHYMYTYNGKFSLGGVEIDAVGSRSSKDGFFKKYRYEGPKDNQKRIELPPSEIDRGDVKKSAYTNLLANGITRLLGLRNLTYDDLKEFAGITEQQVSRVEYKKGNKSTPTQQSQPRTITNPNDPASEAQIKAIHTILGKHNITDDMAKCEKVSELLGLPEVITNISKLTKQEASLVIEGLGKE